MRKDDDEQRTSEGEEWDDRRQVKRTAPKSWEQLPVEAGGRIGWAGGCGYGLLLIVVGCQLSAAAQSPIPFYGVALLSFGFLFSSRTRMIFVGYVSIIAVVLLIFAIVCGSMLKLN